MEPRVPIPPSPPPPSDASRSDAAPAQLVHFPSSRWRPTPPRLRLRPSKIGDGPQVVFSYRIVLTHAPPEISLQARLVSKMLVQDAAPGHQFSVNLLMVF